MTSGARPGSLQTGPIVSDNGAFPAPDDRLGAGLPLSSHSRFAQRLRRRYPGELALLPPERRTARRWKRRTPRCARAATAAATALRIVRQLVMERLVGLDCDLQAPLALVTGTVTALAEFALDVACNEAQRELDAQHGAPLGPDGQRAELWIVGMGKLGARELNVSSDVDLVYVYDHDGETAGSEGGRGRITNHEYFAKAVKIIYGLIGDTTEHGFVFRVDLALRPNGNSGPPVVSLGALEDYFQVQGREWERFAWLKSRIVAPRSCIESGSAQNLRAAVLPFVFRRYLDYSVFDSLRVLHKQIREHAAKRSAGRPERANDVKLSRGGIREDRIHRAAAAGGARRPVSGAAHPPDAAGAAAHRRGGADAAGDGRRAGARLRIPAPGRAPHPVPGRPADPRAAHGLQQRDDGDLALDRPDHGLCRLLPVPARTRRASRTGGAGIRHAAGRGQRSARAAAAPRAAEAPAPDLDALLEQLPAQIARAGGPGRGNPRVLALREDARARLSRLVARTGAVAGAKAGSARKRPCAWPTGSSRCCGARATWRCCWSAPACTSGCCACWARRAGRRATCCSTPA